MSDEPNNGGNGTGKPYTDMTAEERNRLMDFILHQQAQFFADIEATKATQDRNDRQIEANNRQLDALLRLAAAHDTKLTRDENILRMVVRAGRKLRTRVGQTEKRQEESEVDLALVKELLLECAGVSGQNGRDIAQLRQTIEQNAAITGQNGRDIAENNRAIAELRQATAENARDINALGQRLDRLAATVEKLAERNGNGAE